MQSESILENFNIENLDQAKIKGLKGQIITIKYGGNAMLNSTLQQGIIGELKWLYKQGARVVMVHGGGPFINEALERYNIESEFIGGHRVTTKEAMQVVEMALRGNVNGKLVSLCQHHGLAAVGLSGKDGGLVTASPRLHAETKNGKLVELSLGLVGNVASVQPEILHTLLDAGFVPVVAPIAIGTDGNDYNINADIFAGYVAGALKTDHYLVLTDVDGLMTDIKDLSSVIPDATLEELNTTYKECIVGGMLPKIEGCAAALNNGATNSYICNGTKANSILSTLLGHAPKRTRIAR